MRKNLDPNLVAQLELEIEHLADEERDVAARKADIDARRAAIDLLLNGAKIDTNTAPVASEMTTNTSHRQPLKLTPVDIRTIRASREPRLELAAKFKVSRATIGNVIARKGAYRD